MKRKIIRKSTLEESSALVQKLIASSIPMTTIARELGYKSHATVKHWFKTGRLPKAKMNQIKDLLRGV